ncbi:hypothetical protein [Metabacillus niabensis]
MQQVDNMQSLLPISAKLILVEQFKLLFFGQRRNLYALKIR